MSITIPLTFCLLNASTVNHIQPEILLSIISVEGGSVGAVSVNKNGSEDLGIMQINTHAWLKLVSNTFFSGNQQVAHETLANDGCFNIYVGTWILSKAISDENGDIWAGVGRYHSQNPTYKYRYIEKVKKAYERFGG
ncbi:lytic transglycosylase domain-containing protein [Enterobacter quasiroggenkampii]|uniref:lytic transglycosylase domain-containing protein n=1 Tax=Enterobacter TaxID=547 RepID=UPI002FFB33FF